MKLIKFIVYTAFTGCLIACNSTPEKQNIPLNEFLQLTSIESRNIDTLNMLAESYIAENNKAEAVKVFRKMGKICRETNDFIDAIKYHNYALEIAEAIGDKDEIILCLNQIGTDYRRIGAYEEASTYHYRALNRCEEYGDASSDFALKNKVMSLNGIGNIYLMLNNLDEAQSVFNTALAGEMQLESHLGMAINYANLGAIFEMRQQYDSAKIYYEYSMECNKIAKSNLGISLCHNHFGRLAELRGDYAAALQEYHASYNIMDKTADRWHWLEACLSIIRVNIAKGDMGTAAVYIDRAEKTAHNINSNDYLAVVYDMKYHYFEKKGDYYQALNSYIAAKCYIDSTLNLKNVNYINNLRVLYETKKKEVEIATLQKEKTTMTWLSVAFAAIFLLGLTTFFFLWRWISQKKALAEQRILQIEREKQLVAVQAALDAETAERTRLARDLHDGLGGLLSAVKLNLYDILDGDNSGNGEQALSNEQMLNNEQILGSRQALKYNSITDLLDKCINEMRRVAHHLMPDTLLRSGLKSALTDFCTGIPTAEFNYFGNEQRLDYKLETAIYRIAHELINNALKYSGGTRILVQIVQEPKRISLTVQDNGKGFNVKTANGMGLTNVRMRTASFGGTLDIQSSKENGTETNIEFPLT